MTTHEAAELQRAYYARTAEHYDDQHGHEHEHTFALGVLLGLCDHWQARSLLDVGAGTGRVLKHLQARAPHVQLAGIEPVAELRQAGERAGLPAGMLREGSALSLPFPDGAFDVVTAFGVLHHVAEPSRAVREMLRVASKAVLISDANNFGQGRAPVRLAKQALGALRLWKLANLVKTKGRGYNITEGDGLSYSYSVYNDFDLVRSACRTVHTMNTLGSSRDHYRAATHVVLIGVK